MRIALSTSLGCDTDLATALDRIQQVGCPLVDLLTIDGWVHVLPSRLVTDFEPECARVETLLAERGLTPIATNSGLGVQLHDRTSEAQAVREANLAALLRFMDRFQIPTAAIQPLAADRERPYPEVLADCIASVREQVEGGRAAGRTFALELHVYSNFETLDQARALLEAWPDVPLVYDPTHFVMQGLPIRETRWLMERARHAHFRDAARGQIQTPFGEGEVDFDWVLGTMQEIGYAGDVSIEYLGTEEFDVVDSAKRLYGFLMERTAKWSQD